MPTGVYLRTEEHNKNISKSLLGRIISQEWRDKISMANKGNVITMETRKKISIANLGRRFSIEHRNRLSKWLIGHKVSDDTKAKISIAHGGTGISNLTSRRSYHMEDSKYKDWRNNVFQRDNWTCKICGNIGSLQAHHISSWAKYPDLRFEVSNGITLCKKCHLLKTSYLKGIIELLGQDESI